MDRVTFHGPDHFAQTSGGYPLLPFRFMDFDGKKLVVNEVGEHLVLDASTFDEFVSRRIDSNTQATPI